MAAASAAIAVYDTTLRGSTRWAGVSENVVEASWRALADLEDVLLAALVETRR